MKTIDNKLCDYGCGQIALYQLKSGKWCCSEHYTKCPINRKKLSERQKGVKKILKPIPIETSNLCDYGCGQIAKYKFKSGKYCCSQNFRSCPTYRKKLAKLKKGIKHSKPIPIETTELCSYGCGQIAKYKLQNGKLCCRNHYSKCIIYRKKFRESQKGKIKSKPIYIKTTDLCSYGCGQVAKYKLKNGKLCCNKHINKCPIYCITIKKIKDKYPTFYKIEELRYNPDKLNKYEIQVRCKNHNCKNSKEQDGWFIPTKSQLSERIQAIEKPRGYGESNLYCSDECKGGCKLFNVHGDPNKETKKPYTDPEYNIWRQEVLRRQRIEHNTKINFCEMCDSINNLHVHHEKPVKLYPELALDPDNGVILCKKCHFKYGHKTGTSCSTGNLANTNPCD